jgi:hypothetical protein
MYCKPKGQEAQSYFDLKGKRNSNNECIIKSMQSN